jgi:hypothetical protein
MEPIVPETNPMRMPLILLLLTLAVALSAEARIFRWTDENGVTVFSQTPPIDGRASETVRVAVPPPARAPANETETPPPPAQQVDDYLEDKELAKQAEAEAEAEGKAREEACRAARGNLASLEVRGNRLTRLPDGSFQRLTEEQRQKYLLEAQEAIAANCD